MLKISDFYLDKQKSFIPKMNIMCTKDLDVYHVPWIALFSANRWRLDVLTFHIKGFGVYDCYLFLTVDFLPGLKFVRSSKLLALLSPHFSL